MKGKRVLIVDDDPGLRHTTRLILEHKGYDVVLACDGLDAYEKARKFVFDVILMDFRMPGMNGVEVLEELRAVDVEAAVVFVSAYGLDDVLDRVQRASAVDVLRKPVNVEQLLVLLERLCGTGSDGR